ncbi:MAG: hypothetical protein ACJ8FY_22140 [Gemmataceae bacterium]
MASNKKRRKGIKLTNKQKRPRTGPFRHADGDRRHRGGPTADQVIADKRARQLFEASLPPGEEEE